MAELLTLEQLLKELNMEANRSTAWRWRRQGMPFVKLGNQIRYDKDEVLKWLKDKREGMGKTNEIFGEGRTGRR